MDEKTGEIMAGELRCACSTFPIIRGVPRMIYGATDATNWKTAERFGEEWRQFSMLTPEYEAQFLSWIEPVKPDFFVNKVVLDAGCGKGRHMVQALKFGANEVIGVDLSHAVDTAFMHVGTDPRVHIIQADLFHLPLKQVFDYAYSIGVLHHTPDPKRAFDCVVEKVKSNGAISAWVYGREGNDWIIYLINPLRKLTAHIPLSITKAIAYIFTCVLTVLLKTVYAPVQKDSWWGHWQEKLPYQAYLTSIAQYSFKENFSIVFDHLLPEIAFYIPEAEFRTWFKDKDLQGIIITPRYENSWRGFACKP